MNIPSQKQRMLFLASIVLTACASAGRAQSTAFSYQGRLSQNGNPANGSYDLLFQVFDAASGGSSIGGTIATNGLLVTNGLFTAILDFGSTPFNGAARWLQIQVSTNGAGIFTVLLPRQSLTPNPQAIYAISAGTVTNGAISSAHLAANSVATTNLQNSSITSGKISSGQVVKTLNGLTDAVSLTQGANVTINTVGNSLQISAPGGGVTLPYTGISPASTVFSVSNSSSGVAIAGHSANGGIGVFGFSPSNKGIYGLAITVSGVKALTSGDVVSWARSTQISALSV